MVLTYPVGQERAFALELFLYVITFGLYGIYWHYQVHHEVYRQFEVDRDGRSMGVLWLLYARVFFPLIWAYQYVFANNVLHVRRRLGYARGLSGAAMLGLTIPGSVVMFSGLPVLIVGSGFVQTPGGFLILILVAVGLAVAGAVAQVIAYAMLQRNVNQAWRGYAHRMEQISAGPPVRPPGSGGAAPPARPSPAAPGPSRRP